jgi:ubiquinone/menaquinone biosynthesis C-methylase UbiE
MGRVSDADRIMYECGLEVLHPGGRQKTDEMAQACTIGPETRVLDIGGGRGTTACHLARQYGSPVVGIDVSRDMVEAARRQVKEQHLEGLVSVQVADAHDLPFDSGSFDAILIECVTTLLDRDRAFREFGRVLKTGGHLGDLEMTYQKEPPVEFARELNEAWGGFTTMPLQGWQELFRDHGFEVIRVDDFSERLGSMGRTMMKELGVAGVLKMTSKLLVNPGVASGMLTWDRLFKRGEGTLGYGFVVGRKTDGPFANGS